MTLPPPYRSYTFENAETDADPYSSPPLSPRSTGSGDGASYASLPAFDSPPRYSQRLRQIVEKNGHPRHLDLNRPRQQQQQQRPQPPIVVVEKPSMDGYDDEKGEVDPEQINLLTSTDLEEGVIDFDDAYDFTGRRSQHRRTPSGNFLNFWSGGNSRRKSKGGSRVARWQRKFSSDDRELGWLAFIGVAVFFFLLMTAGGVLVAWTAGGHVSPSDLVNKTYWVSSNPQAGVAKVSSAAVVPGGRFIVDTITVEVISGKPPSKDDTALLASH